MNHQHGHVHGHGHGHAHGHGHNHQHTHNGHTAHNAHDGARSVPAAQHTQQHAHGVVTLHDRHGTEKWYFNPADKLGNGTFGSVFRGTDVDGGKVAVKKFNDQNQAQSIATEIHNVREVHSRNVVAYHGVGYVRGDSHPYLVMEFADNGTLEDVIKKHPRGLPMAKVLHYAQGIAAGLVALHARGILHRDIKPANILIDADDNAKLSDLGCSREIHGYAGMHHRMGGTIVYMAPEIINGGFLVGASDIWAVGLTMLEMIIGYNFMLPVYMQCGNNIAAFYNAMQQVRLPQLPQPLSQLVGECLVLAAPMRPSSQQLLYQLNVFCSRN